MLIFDYCNFNIKGIETILNSNKEKTNVSINTLLKIYDIDFNNIKLIVLGFNNISKTGIEDKGDFYKSPLFALEEGIINRERSTINNNAYVDYEYLKSQGVIFIDYPLCLNVNNYKYYDKLWKPFIIKFLKEFSTRNNGMLYLLLGDLVSCFDRYISNGIIYKDKHPVYYLNNNIKMSNNIIDDINKQLKLNNNEEIKWYREI